MPTRLTREEMIELAALLRAGKGKPAEERRWYGALTSNLAHPAVVDLLRNCATAEDVIDTALAYQPQALPPPGEPR